MTNYNKSEVRRMQNGAIYTVKESKGGVDVWYKRTEVSEPVFLGFFPNRDNAVDYINNHQKWVRHQTTGGGNPTRGKQ